MSLKLENLSEWPEVWQKAELHFSNRNSADLFFQKFCIEILLHIKGTIDTAGSRVIIERNYPDFTDEKFHNLMRWLKSKLSSKAFLSITFT